MAAATVYNAPFSKGDLVYHVSLANGIRPGIVRDIKVFDAANEPLVMIYTIASRHFTSGYASVQADELYGELGSAAVDSTGGGALEAYQLLVLSAYADIIT